MQQTDIKLSSIQKERVVVTPKPAVSTVETGIISKAVLLNEVQLTQLATANKDENLPVAEAPQQFTSDPTQLFEDRYDANLRWYLPHYSIQLDTLNFAISKLGSSLRDVNRTLFEGQISIGYTKTMHPNTKKKLDELKVSHPSIVAREIVVLSPKVKVGLYNKSASARTLIMYIDGNFTPDGRIQLSVADSDGTSSQLGMDYLKLLYKNFANPENNGESSSITISGYYSFWYKKEDESQKPTDLTKVVYTTQTPPIIVQKQEQFAMASAVGISSAANSAAVTPTKKVIDSRVIYNQYFPVKSYIYSKQTNNFSVDLNVVAPCFQYGNCYSLKEGANVTKFGCTPPWQQLFVSNIFFKKILLADNELSLKADIYQSFAQPQIFLIAPKQYYIAREPVEDGAISCKPLLEMNTMMDPDDQYKNDINFKFTIAPNVTKYDRLRLVSLLASYTPIIGTEPMTPVLKFPADFGKLPKPTYNPIIKGDYMLSSATDPRNYYLDFLVGEASKFETNDPKTPVSTDVNATFMYNILTETNTGGITHTLEYSFDSLPANVTNASAFITLSKTVGNTLLVTKDTTTGSIKITNYAECEANINNVALFKSDTNVSKIHHLAVPLKLGSKQSIDITLAELPQFAINDFAIYDSICLDSALTEDGAKTIQQNDLPIDLLQQTIVITSNISAAESKLKKIGVELIFPISAITVSQELFPLNNTFVNINTKPFNLLLPAGKYKNPTSKIMNYRVTLTFNDNTVKSTPLTFQNFGEQPTIFLSPAILQTAI